MYLECLTYPEHSSWGIVEILAFQTQWDIVKDYSLPYVGIQTLNIHSILFDTKAERSLSSGHSVENAAI